MLGSVAVGVGNYAFSLILVWLLPSSQFSAVASASALLLVVGTASTSVLPWVVARPVARSAFGSAERRQAVGFALAAAVGIGGAIGVAMALLAAPYAPIGISLLLALTSVALFVAGVGTGYLIGAERFSMLAVVSIVEVLIKLGAGAGLAAAGGGATGAFAGSAFGALVWAAVALWVIRREVSWPRSRPPAELWRQLGGVGATQVLVSVVTTLDVIVGSIVIGAGGGLATYQAMLVFSRIPLFVSTAVSGVTYPKLVSHDSGLPRVVSDASTLYLLLSLPIVVAVATLPGPLLGVVLPHRYLHHLGLLVPMTIAGLAAGQINLSTTFLQALLVFRSCIRVLAVAVVSITLVFIGGATSIAHLAWAAAITLGLLAGVVLALTSVRFGPARLVTKTFGALMALAGVEGLLRALTPTIPAWIAAVAVVGGLSILAARPKLRRPGPRRVLFLRGQRPPSPHVDEGLRTLQDYLATTGFEVIVGFAVAPPRPARQDRARRPVRVDGRTRRPGYRWWDGGLWRATRAALLLYRSQPDLLVEEVRAPFVGAVAPWWHRGAAVAIVDGMEGAGHSRASGLGTGRRRRLRSYEHTVSASRHLVTLDAAAAAAFVRDPATPAWRARFGPFVAACRFACQLALAERDDGEAPGFGAEQVEARRDGKDRLPDQVAGGVEGQSGGV